MTILPPLFTTSAIVFNSNYNVSREIHADLLCCGTTDPLIALGDVVCKQLDMLGPVCAASERLSNCGNLGAHEKNGLRNRR